MSSDSSELRAPNETMAVSLPGRTHRFASVTEEKADGVTYTPRTLADFVSTQILRAAELSGRKGVLQLLDPAVGDGELLVSLASKLVDIPNISVHFNGYDTDSAALKRAEARIRRLCPKAPVDFTHGSFLDVVAGSACQRSLFESPAEPRYDFVIANPPYARTQIMGASRAQELARTFGLNGRVDTYYAFILGISTVLKSDGVAGIIVSNRFMSTRSGESVRRSILNKFSLLHVWDFGDTKLFDAAVLPAVLLVKPKANGEQSSKFTTIYETNDSGSLKAACPVEAVEHSGVVEVKDGRRFRVVSGLLAGRDDEGDVWRVATQSGDSWLATVQKHSWGKFGDIGKIRVGVKTCADKVFIRDDWDSLSQGERPELLKPLTTHHIGRRYKPLTDNRERFILYPHEVVDGERRVVDLSKFPASRKYLEEHRATLEGRSYVLKAGRKWYEIWVPQDPAAWDKPKLVFRDISEEPMFWLDFDRSVVNGDCYWVLSERHGEDLLWLAAAVGNSKFAEQYYDHMFNNKLYAGRRRFITQYVQEFPLPDPSKELSKRIIAKAKHLYQTAGTAQAEADAAELEVLVHEAFGLGGEKIAGKRNL